jgi:PiT family inorganic phosphate transporter
MELGIMVALVAVALGFSFTNGFHDAAQAIASSVSTRALTPTVALVLAAVMNFVGAFLGQAVAHTVSGIVVPRGSASQGLLILLCALVGATAWNLLTWYVGLPSSSSHALIGALVGSALASGSLVRWSVLVAKVLVPMLVAPAVGFALAFSLMVLIMWAFRTANRHKTSRGFRLAQTASTAAMALGHGLQDAQKTMGVLFLALVITGSQRAEDHLPAWVVVASAGAIALGTFSGGWRVMRSLGRRIIHLDPPQGLAAESAASSVLYLTAVFAAPISTTHSITASIVGVGVTRRRSAVRWGLAHPVVTAWLLTFPAAALAAALPYWLLHDAFRLP